MIEIRQQRDIFEFDLIVLAISEISSSLDSVRI